MIVIQDSKRKKKYKEKQVRQDENITMKPKEKKIGSNRSNHTITTKEKKEKKREEEMKWFCFLVEWG